MGKNEIVWGIDIGNTSLKAICCRRSADPGKIEVLGYDFIEHSKILSQPGAEPEEILAETMKEFFTRNKIRGHVVGISVSGQNTISRFLKLPPVDASKVPDIIRYEAKQWLPFDLRDVVWDYQPIGKKSLGTGIVLDADVGMFAMKREATLRQLAPYEAARVNVDCIQSSPIATYNCIAYDQLRQDEAVEGETGSEQVIILSVGTDATDIIITDGVAIWTRSVPVGGNQFTKALTKGMKQTFAKAEYIKRNTATTEDSKMVFQAMRPVFNDLLSEVHRSLEYYSNLNRKAKFSRVIGLGNALKLPGLCRFLSQNLGLEVVRLSSFDRLSGPEIIESEGFKENAGSLAVAYGIAVQLLGRSEVSTNLIPRDIVNRRLLNRKKSWFLAASALILLGLTLGYYQAVQMLYDYEEGQFQELALSVSTNAGRAKDLTKKANDAVKEFIVADKAGQKLTGSVEGRIIWLEFFRALNAAIPTDSTPLPEDETFGEALSQLKQIYITSVEAPIIPDPQNWWNTVRTNGWYVPSEQEWAEAQKGVEAAQAEEEAQASRSSSKSSSGSSFNKTAQPKAKKKTPWDFIKLPTSSSNRPVRLVTLKGYHFHNRDVSDLLYGANFVRNTLCQAISNGGVELPVSMKRMMTEGNQSADMEYVPFSEFGFAFPTVINPVSQATPVLIVDPKAAQEQEMRDRLGLAQGGTEQRGRVGGRPAGGPVGTGGGGVGGLGRNPNEGKIEVQKYEFTVQFLWYETPPSVRDELFADQRAERAQKQNGGRSSKAGLGGDEEEEGLGGMKPDRNAGNRSGNLGNRLRNDSPTSGIEGVEVEAIEIESVGGEEGVPEEAGGGTFLSEEALEGIELHESQPLDREE
ncbi:MAG: type IV pilus assembly protein PilM [Thermoguttaceae bacterium]